MGETGTQRIVATTPYEIATRFLGMTELAGSAHNPQIVAMLQLNSKGVNDDETAWCSAFVNYPTWLLGCKRSGSLAARSWLRVGEPIDLKDARPGFDVVILQRGEGKQPGPDVIAAPGHVGFFHSLDGGSVYLLGGNQGNRVSIAPFPVSRVLGVRRL